MKTETLFTLATVHGETCRLTSCPWSNSPAEGDLQVSFQLAQYVRQLRSLVDTVLLDAARAGVTACVLYRVYVLLQL